ncbi:MAG: hypothetical protein Fur003_3350 [Candidatus Dojkabacteria bacterium]
MESDCNYVISGGQTIFVNGFTPIDTSDPIFSAEGTYLQNPCGMTISPDDVLYVLTNDGWKEVANFGQNYVFQDGRYKIENRGGPYGGDFEDNAP